LSGRAGLWSSGNANSSTVVFRPGDFLGAGVDQHDLRQSGGEARQVVDQCGKLPEFLGGIGVLVGPQRGRSEGQQRQQGRQEARKFFHVRSQAFRPGGRKRAGAAGVSGVAARGAGLMLSRP
jgi:hypothetical protein